MTVHQTIRPAIQQTIHKTIHTTIHTTTEPSSGLSTERSNGPAKELYTSDVSKSTSNHAAARYQEAASVRHPDVQVSAAGKTLSESSEVYRLQMADGSRDVDLNTYFDRGTFTPTSVLDVSGLMLPSIDNVRALQTHINNIFPAFLAEHNIPEAPSEIRFNGQGEPVFPDNYPYKDALTQAFEDDPVVLRKLSTVNALSSHMAALQALAPLHEELAAASSQTEKENIVQKYSHLLNDNAQYPQILLSFGEDGVLQVKGDGKALV